MDSPKDLIKARLSIDLIVGSYISLIPSGRYFKARCPFHNEKTPSFIVTPDRGTFHCFGCHKGGDIFAFVQEIEGIDFKESLHRLADKAGIELKQYQEFAKEKSTTQVLYEICEMATKFFEVAIRQSPAIVEYLISRGLTKDTIKTWRIGYATDGFRAFLEYASRKYSADDLVRAGLVVKGEKGTYDRFRDRIMFPISDSQGRIVAFTGRMSPSLEKKEIGGGKYVNSPETPIYHKSNILYGYHQAKQALRKENQCILVEGQMDLLMLHQSGFANVVALSGTACTDAQLQLIERFTDTLVISLDADQAGIRAGWKTAENAYRKGFHVYGIVLPPGQDPADCLKVGGTDSFSQILSRKRDFILLQAENLRHAAGDSHSESRSITKEIIPLVVSIPNFILQERLVTEIATIMGTSTEALSKEIERYRTTHREDYRAPVSNEMIVKGPIRDAPDQELILSYVGLVVAFWAETLDEKMASLRQYIPKHLEEFVEHALGMADTLATEAEVVYSTWTTENVHHAADEILLRIQISHTKHLIGDVKQQLQNEPSDSVILERYGQLVKELDSLQQKVRQFDTAPGSLK